MLRFNVRRYAITWLFTATLSIVTNTGLPEANGADRPPTALEQNQNQIKKSWAGIRQGDYSIPYASLPNRFLQFLGLTREVRGRLVNFYPHEKGFHFVAGKGSTFGGPNDTGVTKTETAAITGQILRQMDSDHDYYAAMRFNYGKRARDGLDFWKDARLLLVNPKTGQAVIVRPVDWGPHPRTNRIVDMSKGAMKALGGRTDDTYWVSFAEPGSRLGPVR